MTLLRVSWPGLAVVILALHFLPSSVLSDEYPHTRDGSTPCSPPAGRSWSGCTPGCVACSSSPTRSRQLEEGPPSALDELLTCGEPLDGSVPSPAAGAAA